MMLKRRWWSAVLATAFLWGCGSAGAPSVHYTLQAPDEASQPKADERVAQWVIGLGPVKIPEYLDRNALVTRVSPNRLEVNEDHRWAGSLQSEILRVTAANLEHLTGAGQVLIYPWRTRIKPDLRLRMEIKAFEGRRGDRVTLKAAWTLSPITMDRPSVRRLTLIEEQTLGNGMEDLVAAMGRALYGLSREMAAAVDKTAH